MKDRKKKKKDQNIEDKTKKKEKEEAESSKGKEKAKFDDCFICDGPHMARNSPMREKIVNCLLAETDDVEPEEDPMAYVNTLIVLLSKKEAALSQFISARAPNQTGGGFLLDP
ncbi:hypothetical protein KY290_036868 [Solanum tuberosum]|uniref:Uncharacterized protein n=1 Tax=Solanum tuberosum TaxID=4113 RepID=A0ABQ7TUQ6_SOLTU|nr:hypothetical protein KY289_036337 [Solanum tuberosum]KAH0639605.1 hypothetical protein KY285_036191 [Solanum tuberosum]KAH0738163.1 hypothetical protein KY290_036868 [Solanum tuberosum]